MPEDAGGRWLIERGIGEVRALLVAGDEVLASRLHWPGELFSGQRLRVRLASRQKGTNRALAITEAGTEILLDRVPGAASEGSQVDIVITRAPMAERGRLKRAQGRLSAGREIAVASPVDLLRDPYETRRFPAGLWEEIWHQAAQGELAFTGGSLNFSVTPAMTLIDVDGEGSPRELALAAIPAIARAIRQFDLGGSIGIDFPTIAEKAARRALDETLDEALSQFPHERTAMNGFGFVQIVARLEGPSLLHRLANSRASAAVRFLLRQAEADDGAGALLLTCHPALKARLNEQWTSELSRRTGREVRIETDPALALEGGFAQVVPS